MRAGKTSWGALILLTSAPVSAGDRSPVTAADLFGPLSAATGKPEADAKAGTELARFAVRGSDNKGKLQSFAVDSQGHLVTAIAPPLVYGEAKQADQPAGGEVQVLSSSGKQLHAWPVPFAPQRVAVGPEDEVFVGGAGQLARYSSTGKLLTQKESPHLAEALGDRERLHKAAEEERQSLLEMYGEQIKRFEEQLKTLDKQIAKQKDRAERDKTDNNKASSDKASSDKASSDKAGSDAESSPDDVAKSLLRQPEAQKKMYEQMLTTYRRALKQVEKQTADDFVISITQRLQKIHAITVSGQDVFVATAMPKGYGFAVWRTDLDFKAPQQIVSGLSGCCGQMDIQAREGELFVAENSKKRVCRFDREGKRLGQFGKADREGAGAGFGGCCNPMNLCFTKTGDVLTAESEGRVKRFTSSGDFQELSAQAKVSGGCKNVAIGVSPNGKRIYFFNLDKSEIIVLSPQGSSPPTTAKSEG